ncbi:hypothetical protein BJ165DRAFT_1535490 [Panaeolus papilionaceus]|nr:hypothetical protein BJ165DRAFT_1535490 [Panaeolus papilionaceus]
MIISPQHHFPNDRRQYSLMAAWLGERVESALWIDATLCPIFATYLPACMPIESLGPYFSPMVTAVVARIPYFDTETLRPLILLWAAYDHRARRINWINSFGNWNAV